jgi:hypothetical protein
MDAHCSPSDYFDDYYFFPIFATRCKKHHQWKVGRVVDGGSLENC